jgi:hypothetical protein
MMCRTFKRGVVDIIADAVKTNEARVQLFVEGSSLMNDQ